MKLPLSLKFSSVLLFVADILDTDSTPKLFARSKDFTIQTLSILTRRKILLESEKREEEKEVRKKTVNYIQ